MEYKLNDGIATISLDDGKANVIGHELLDQMNVALDSAEAEAEAVIKATRYTCGDSITHVRTKCGN